MSPSVNVTGRGRRGHRGPGLDAPWFYEGHSSNETPPQIRFERGPDSVGSGARGWERDGSGGIEKDPPK